MTFDIEAALAEVINRAKLEITQLRFNVDVAEKQILSLTTQRDAYANDNEELRVQLTALRQKAGNVEELERRVRRLTNECEELRRERVDLPVNQRLVDELIFENADLKTRLEMYSKDNAAKTERIAALHAQLQAAVR